jgi:hypothetical protein
MSKQNVLDHEGHEIVLAETNDLLCMGCQTTVLDARFLNKPDINFSLSRKHRLHDFRVYHVRNEGIHIECITCGPWNSLLQQQNPIHLGYIPDKEN